MKKWQASIFDELIVDNFAGGGGASTGIELAIGRPVDIAINHDPDAIEMHKRNHPFTTHYCEDVWEVDPRKVAAGRRVGLVWLSPDCTHHSKARGGKPRKKEIRGLAWVAVRWAATVKPRVIALENVEEFQDWGPLDDEGMPIKDKKGKTFRNFIKALEDCGYAVDWKELRACDYGAPTIRKRLFLIARCDGKPIVWPQPTHAAPDSEAVRSGKLKAWRAAAEIIDWSLPCPSIFATSEEIYQEYGLRAVRPLAENTMRRIARGIQKFVIDNPDPFIMRVNYSGAEHHYCNSIDEPLNTITAIDHNALVTSQLTLFRNNSDGQDQREPLNTIMTSAGHFGEVRALLIKYYSGDEKGQPISSPLHTITTKDRIGLVTISGQQYAITDIGLRMLTPRELFNAQGFPKDYVIDVGALGKPLSKSLQVAKCGNAVPPPFSEAIVRANLPELCGKRIETMDELMQEMAG